MDEITERSPRNGVPNSRQHERDGSCVDPSTRPNPLNLESGCSRQVFHTVPRESLEIIWLFMVMEHHGSRDQRASTRSQDTGNFGHKFLRMDAMFQYFRAKNGIEDVLIKWQRFTVVDTIETPAIMRRGSHIDSDVFRALQDRSIRFVAATDVKQPAEQPRSRCSHGVQDWPAM